MHLPVRIIFVFLLAAISFALVAATRTSVNSGNWSVAATWDCNCIPASTDDVIISAGTKVALTSNTITQSFTINAGGIFYNGKSSLEVWGNYTVNGDHVGDNDTYLRGTNTTIDGSGTIHQADLRIRNGNKTILASANLTKSFGKVRLMDPITVTNLGTITIGGELDGSSGAVWINGTGSTLNLKENIFLSGGSLVASASGNTVRYYGEGQPVIVPSGGTYHHLTVEGSAAKMLQGAVTIDGNLVLGSAFDCNSYNMVIKGNWSCDRGDFIEGTALVTFSGTADQYLNNISNEMFYDLQVSKTAGTLILNDTVTVRNNLAMAAGNINASSARLIVGTSTASEGSLTYTGGIIIGELQRWVNTVSLNYLFPIGNAVDYRYVAVSFASLTGGTLTARFIEENPGNAGFPLFDAPYTLYNTFVEGYWELVPEGVMSASYTVNLAGTGFTSFTVNAATRAVFRPSPTDPWLLNGIHLAGSPPVVKRTLMTGFGQYAFGDTTNCAVPVTSPVSGPVSTCINSTGVSYSVTLTPGSTYDWEVTGGTVASGQGTNAITVDWGPAGMYGSVSVVETNSCSEGIPSDTLVAVHPLPTSSITGKVNVSDFTTGEPYSVTHIAGYVYTWTVTGGTLAGGQGTSAVTVDWGAAGPGQICVVGSNACGATDTECLAINIYIPINSISTGSYGSKDTWNCSCMPLASSNVRIMSTHIVTLDSSRTANHFEVRAGGVFDDNGKSFTVTGDFTIDGDYDGTDTLNLAGVNTIIDGVGEMTHNGLVRITGGSKRVASAAFLSKDSGNLIITNVLTITNYGTIEFGANVDGERSNAQWVNEASSMLTVGGSLMSTGKLFATAAGNRVVYDGTADQTLKSPQSVTYHTLAINKPGGKAILPGTIKVTDLEMRDGKIELGAYRLIMLEGGTLVSSSDSSYVIADGSGAFQKNFNSAGSFTFPVGDGNGYSPFSVNVHTASFGGSAYLRVNVTDAKHPMLATTNYITRYWTLKSHNFTAINYDVGYQFIQPDTVGDESTLRTARWDGSSWTFYELVNPVTNNLFTISGIPELPDYHDFTGGNGSVLPVTLIDFRAEVSGGSVALTWTMSMELNNDYFAVEKSWDGINFTRFATVNSQGNTYCPVTYSCTDHQPLPGVSYYRLIQTDIDGSENILGPVAVYFENNPAITIYPNPLLRNQSLNISLPGALSGQPVLVVLYDSFGRTIYSKLVMNQSDGFAEAFSLNLVPGLYYIVASGSGRYYREKLVVSSGK